MFLFTWHQSLLWCSVLIDDRLDLKINKIDSQNYGRSLLLDVMIEGYNIILVNVYAPTKKTKRERFFMKMNKWLSLSDQIINQKYFR